MAIRQVDEPAHVVTMGVVEEGVARWDFRCLHGSDVEHWWTLYDNGEVHSHDCWLLSWWEGLGQELLEMRLTPPLTLAVRPADNWTFDDGGTLEWDCVST